jgi:FSR family fosmidomycin resistance protein-like MFS transporter
VFAVLVAISVSHMLNDTIQSLLMGIYPVLRDSFALDYTQIGLLSFTFLVTASVLQPVIGIATDRRPMPWSLPLGMAASLAGLILLSVAPNYAALLAAAALIGLGSAVFHPEASRVARLASGGRFGVAQSIFQVGGNVGTAIGPLLAAAIVVPYGQSSIAWFSILALIALAVLWRVGDWYKRTHFTATRKPVAARATIEGVSRGRIVAAIAVLMALIFSKFFYLESFRSYYTFYLIDKYGLDIQTAQVLLFVQLFAIVVGTLIGGPIGDRSGRKYVIWASILGILPLTLILPHVGLVATVLLTIPIGIGLASAFPAIVVFAQELLPGRTGMVSGLFFGLAFGVGGVGAALLGYLADRTSIEFVYQVSAFLPAIGLLTVFLPNIDGRRR